MQIRSIFCRQEGAGKPRGQGAWQVNLCEFRSTRHLTLFWQRNTQQS